MDLITKLMLDITIDRPLDLPKNYYEARQLVAKLGLGAKRIDCCVNGCMLYYSNEFGVADDALHECKFCQEPRYRVTRNSRSVRRKPIPRKAIFHLPIIPRLQRLYASMQTASKMTWHRENYERRKMSGELRHPSDGMAWKYFDQVYPEFASEPRNSQVTWLNHHTAAIEAIFNKKATKRLSTLLFEARKKIKKDPSKPPLWLAGNSYAMLCLRWEEEEYKAKCIKNKANRNTDEANRACVHSGGSKSAGTLRLEFIQQFGRPPTFMEMNDMMHKYADSGEWTGARAQEVSRLTQIWAEEYNASQLRLPPHRRDNEEVRRNKMSLAFVKNAGGATRGRKFAAGCTSSLYASDPTGLRDVTYTSSSSSSTGRSRPAQRQETYDEYEARMRATYREEFRDEYEATFNERVDQRVQHLLQEFFAQQRAPAPAPAGVGSSSQGSARQNQNAGEQEYRPDLNSMVNLNQLPEYREGDPVLSMSIEDMSQMLNEPIHLQFFDPVGQTSGSSSGGSGRNNQQTAFTEYHRQRSSNPYQQDFIIPHDNPNQPQDNFFPNQANFDPNQAPNFVHRPVARPPRTTLPPFRINEGGRGQGQGRPRKPTYSGKGKRPLDQPSDRP
ncbi:unnamed protein product [Trifolium pratense]|uniref:Uncharacterized protein n=1 Tax=Trifolium pratense TaxID=57577 RepID=A0ACB0JW43_TRIPR|nr:unnamed protein product [Trifolium pratense]